MNFHLLPPTCTCTLVPPYARAEVGGRHCRQPGQVRKEAATTISCRVVGFHLLDTAASTSAHAHPKWVAMTDSREPFPDEPEDKPPSAAELEAEGQVAMFGD